jgi:hypothetical protein
MNKQAPTTLFISLTALWAFVESGLGGMLHAFHLPFTGIILGGFSVLIVSLLGHYFEKPFTSIIQATGIVLLIKAAVAPSTSPFAYIAVGFQGVLGAFIFSFFKNNIFANIIYAVLAMIESAIQKLLTLTIFGGKELWLAFDEMCASILKIFGLTTDYTVSSIVVWTYIGLFAIWGIILGYWSYILPTQIEAKKEKYNHISPIESSKEKKKNNKWIFIFAAFIIIAITFFFQSKNSWIGGLVYIIRTASIVLIWIYLIGPFISKWILQWASNRASNSSVIEVKNYIPVIQIYVSPLYKEISKTKKGFSKIKEFILGIITISIYPPNEKS